MRGPLGFSMALVVLSLAPGMGQWKPPCSRAASAAVRQIDYYTQTAASTVVVTDALANAARAYTLLGLGNGQWYTATLTTVGVIPPSTDTVCVMPTNTFVHLPVVSKEN